MPVVQGSSYSPGNAAGANNTEDIAGYAGLQSIKDPSKRFADILKDRYRSFQNDYAPFEQRLLDRSRNDTSLIDQAKGQGAGLRATAEGIHDRNQQRYGLSATSVQARQRKKSTGLNAARAQVQAVSDARINQYESNKYSFANLVNIGQGIQRSSLQGINSAANMQSQRNQAYASAKASYQQAKIGAISGLVSSGASAFAF